MEHIWSPWRYKYVAEDSREAGCVFCTLHRDTADLENYVILRDSLNFVVLNRYPYTSGHLMVVPYQHEASLLALDRETSYQMMELAKQALGALQSEYHPDGFNVGINLGKSAGAGVADHLHMHVVPRWEGDANFLSVVGETRVLPEALEKTYHRLRNCFIKG